MRLPTRDGRLTLLSLAWLTSVLLISFTPSMGFTQQTAASQVEPLWPEGAPNAVGEEDVDWPSLTIQLPPAEEANGTAVVVFPGGGYGHLAMDHEGHQVAEWLNSLGVAAFIVTYRLGPRYKHPTMLLDAQRSIRTVRARASEWGIDDSRIGVLGFSAGGHLASTAGTHFDAGNEESADPIETVSSRPDFMILVYPVITMMDEHTHQGSKQNLLGADPDRELVELLSNERQVTAATPPIFLVHTTDDDAVPVENSLGFYTAARKAGVPVEMHVFESGPHGFGLGGDSQELSRWPSLAAGWMEAHGWLDGR